MKYTKLRRPLTDAERRKANVVVRWLVAQGSEPREAAMVVASYSFVKLKNVHKTIRMTV